MKIRRFIKSFGYGEKGFTLIELLVVIAILGILAAIVVPNFATFFGRGEEEACDMELAMVKTATMAFVSENGACPAAIGDLDEYFEDPTNIQGTYSWAAYPACTVSQAGCP